jgi:Protein of unknown function (DUF2924)
MKSALDLSKLPRLSLAQLREVWHEHHGNAKPPGQKRLLMRELAWHYQESISGGLDAPTHRLLKAAMARADRESLRNERNSSVTAGRSRSRVIATASPRRAVEDLPAGSRLIREWRGRTHEVTVVTHTVNGKPKPAFRYRDKEYASLTEVTQMITGLHWSGPRFFGLVSRARRGRSSP